MAQQDLELRKAVDDPTADDRPEGESPLGQIADRIVQVIAVNAPGHHGVVRLVEEDDRVEPLRSIPERQEFWLVECPPVHVVVDHHALEAHAHHSGQLDDRGRDVLHRERGEARKPVGMCRTHLGDLVVALSGDEGGVVGLVRVLIEASIGRHHLHVHAQRVHVRQPLG